ncbi:hypothetical protein BDZ45DRAFT_740095 [Acephala macrosclerotiorum]|nr:hypothetical protein BDZ45DRAFT_740095 [Acephala macrosclerotiorum]
MDGILRPSLFNNTFNTHRISGPVSRLKCRNDQGPASQRKDLDVEHVREDCEGYPAVHDRNAASKPPLPKHPVSILPRAALPKRIRSTKALIEPSLHLRFHREDERRYFNVFETKTAPELTGFFKSRIWNRLMLQASHEELYAWHAVVAIGALQRTLEIANCSNDTTESKRHHTVTLKQYGIALKYMREVSYIGNQEDALTQAQAGVDVLTNWRFNCPKQDDDAASARKIAARSKFLDEDLIGAFTRLDFQVMQFKDTVKGRPLSPQYPTIPPKFESELVAYEEVTTLWYEKFKPLFEESRKKPGSKMFLGASMMMVRYIPSKFAISKKAPNCGVYADEYLEDYKTVNRLVREVLEEHTSLPPRKAAFGRRHFSAEEAIALLVKHPRREGLWDSLMAARVATWLMEREEEEMVDGYVPETARLRIVKNNFVLKERKAVIRCSKLVEGCTERAVLSDVTLTW